MKHAVIHQTIVVSMEHLTHQEKVFFQAARKTAEPAQKAFIQAISHIQAQSVNIPFFYPLADAFQQILNHFLISEI